jgi:hypothetical protein
VFLRYPFFRRDGAGAYTHICVCMFARVGGWVVCVGEFVGGVGGEGGFVFVCVDT